MLLGNNTQVDDDLRNEKETANKMGMQFLKHINEKKWPMFKLTRVRRPW